MDLKAVSAYRTDWVVSFVAVARHGGFSAAAKALYRSQPRVSSHVADLEQVLGTRLFDRSVHPARLTPQGRALLPHAEEVVRRLDLLGSAAAGGSDAGRSVVRLGSYPSAAVHLVPWLATRLEAEAPHVRLQLHEGSTTELNEALGHGDVELAVRPLMPLTGDTRFAHTPLWSEPLVAVVAADHPLAAVPGVHVAQLAQLPLITVGGAADTGHRQYEAHLALAAVGVEPVVAFHTQEPQTMVALAREGLGVGITNALAVTTARSDGVVAVPVLDDPRARVVALWWRTDLAASPAVDAVREAVTAVPAPVWPWSARGEREDPPAQP